jgi:hypothetical protein
VAERRTVHAEHHAVVGLPVDAVGRCRAGRRSRHGGNRSHAAARISPTQPAAEGSAALWLCIVGLLGVFAVGYPGYFVFDAIWPSYYYSPVAAGKNAWLLGQALFIAVYFVGLIIAFNRASRGLALAAQQTPGG